jgi:hypothetical protein
MSTRRIKGDTTPFEDQLKWDDGTVIDLTLATSVKFTMRAYQATTDKVAGVACSITDASNGKVKYNWIAGNVDTAGMYKYKYVITFTDTTILTVPSGDIAWMFIIDPTWT